MNQPIYQRLDGEKTVCTIKEQIKIDVKTEVPSDSVKTVLSIWHFENLLEPTVTDGKIVADGKIIFYITYLNTDGKIEKCECGGEITGVIKDGQIKADNRVILTHLVEKLEHSLSGARLGVSALLTLTGTALEDSSYLALEEAQDLIVDKRAIEHCKSLGTGTLSYPFEDEFTLSYSVEEVLCHKVDAFITETSLSETSSAKVYGFDSLKLLRSIS